MAEEFIVGLQVVRFYIERLQLRVATEVDGWGSQALSGPLTFTQEEGHRRGARSVVLERFADRKNSSDSPKPRSVSRPP
jgi:hypothetical protein